MASPPLFAFRIRRMRRAVHRGIAVNAAACHRSLTSSAARRTVAAVPAGEALGDSGTRPSTFLGAGAAAVLFLTGVYAWNLPPQRPKPPHVGGDTTLSNWCGLPAACPASRLSDTRLRCPSGATRMR